jgi:hypothetical protein
MATRKGRTTGFGIHLLGAVLASSAAQGAPDRTTRPGPAAAEAKATPQELIRSIDEMGAIYLAADGRCEEWKADSAPDRILLSREYYAFEDEMGKQRRYRQSRTMHISKTGLVLSGSVKWAVEERRSAGSGWRAIDGVAGGTLCVSEPTVRRVRRDLHYTIGGAELFLSRRACEAHVAAAARRNVRLASCGGK